MGCTTAFENDLAHHNCLTKHPYVMVSNGNGGGVSLRPVGGDCRQRAVGEIHLCS